MTLFILLVLAGCSKQMDSSQVRQDAFDMLHHYHEAMERDGLLAEFEFLDDSPEFFWIPPGYMSALDYDSVKTILENNAPAISSIQIKWENLEVNALTSETATFHGVVISAMTDTSGQVNSARMLESGTLIRRTDGWKLLSGQTRLLSSE